jgi:hypothetical protein
MQQSPGPDSSSDERRERFDRRRRPTRPWDSLRGWTRRRNPRRGPEGPVYVDVFSPRDVLLLLAIFLLNLLDAGLTLLYLSQGGSEGNPAMAHLLEIGSVAFLGQKCLVVGVWLLFLIVHKNFRVARYGLWTLLGLYACVFAYHCVLQLQVRA